MQRHQEIGKMNCRRFQRRLVERESFQTQKKAYMMGRWTYISLAQFEEAWHLGTKKNKENDFNNSIEGNNSY